MHPACLSSEVYSAAETPGSGWQATSNSEGLPCGFICPPLGSRTINLLRCMGLLR